jgi:DNA gyrase subunit A
MELGLVRKIDIDEEMQQAYLDYAMSVIIARALPDARDGLKPVHRRILYAMQELGLRPDTPYKKSARIVGEVLGKYHPHGDEAVYDSMARMAQDFSMRYLLVEGQGNFGSVDGDPPAAMRYTEARLAPVAGLMLADIDKQTVDVEPNFDDTLTEPSVLPAALPNLLVNGATGIAVGMATSIPPHNLSEVINALHYLLGRWDALDDISIEDLMRYVQGPDFPTGGIIIQEAEGEGLVSAYSTGRGRVTVQANAHLEEMERGRSRIIVSELPYMTNKSSLIERIASLVREERLDGIADLRDESDRQGMRIVIELNKTADPHQVLSDLYKTTPMQSTFSIIMLALVDGEPRLLSLKQALRVYLEHRLEIVRRRSLYELERARQREHILAGLRIAILNLDEVIDLIRKSANAEAARERLMKRFKLSELQAQAILDMPLKRLAALERKKIEEEYKAVVALIKELEGLLRSPKKMRQVVGDELQKVKDTYADRRRTHIVHLKEGEKLVSKLTASDLTPEKTVWVSVTSEGLISRSLDSTPTLDGPEAPAWAVQANTRDTLYLADITGEAAAIAVHALPEAAQPSDGAPLSRVTALKTGQPLAVVFPLPGKDLRKTTESGEAESYIITATLQGMVKKSAVTELPGPSASSFTLVRVNDGDRLGWVCLSQGSDDILLATSAGMSIRFSEAEVRPMGLVAAGVMGIKLQADDEIVGLDLADPDGAVFFMASDGSAKRVPLADFSRQGRYGQGLVAWKLPGKLKVIAMTSGPGSQQVILHATHHAPRTIRLDLAPLQTRTARGKVIEVLKAGEQIERLTIPWGLIPTTDPTQKGGRGDSQGGKSAPAMVKPTRRNAKAVGDTAPSKRPPKAAAGGEVPPSTAMSRGKTGTPPAPASQPAPRSPAKSTRTTRAAKTKAPAAAAKSKGKTGTPSAPASQPAPRSPATSTRTTQAAEAKAPAAPAKSRGKTGTPSAPASQPAPKPPAKSSRTTQAAATKTPAAPAKSGGKTGAPAKPASQPARKPSAKSTRTDLPSKAEKTPGQAAVPPAKKPGKAASEK